MKLILWALIGAAAGLMWLTVESMMGMHAAGNTHAPTVLWLVIAPIVAIGAMLHQRHDSEFYSYLKAVKIGVMATLCVSLALVVVWALFLYVFNTDYLSMLLGSEIRDSALAGETKEQTAVRMSGMKLIFQPINFLIFGGLLPAVSGVIASFVAAAALQKKVVKKS